MKLKSARSRVAAKAVSVIVAAAAVALIPAQQAQALGNNRDVSRGCGTNHVASGRNSATSAWAQTTRINGNCSGRLSAALRSNSGFTFPRVYGNQQIATAMNTDSSGFGTGLHWGCDACNVTTS